MPKDLRENFHFADCDGDKGELVSDPASLMTKTIKEIMAKFIKKKDVLLVELAARYIDINTIEDVKNKLKLVTHPEGGEFLFVNNKKVAHFSPLIHKQDPNGAVEFSQKWRTF